MSLFGDIFYGTFGGSDAPPSDPNIGLAAQSNAAIGERMQTLAETQYTDQKALLDKYSPMLKEQIQAAIDAQTKSTAQSDDQWTDYKTTFRPVEQQLAKQSLAYSDPNRIDQEAARAGDMAQTNVDQAQSQNEQSLTMAGASPEKIAALQAAGKLVGAKTVAGAQYQGRTDAQGKAMAYLDNTARFGRNMTSTGIATAQLAGQQGQAATAGYGSLSAATGAPAQSAAGLFGGAVGANNAAGSLFSTGWNQKFAGIQADNKMVGDMLGASANVAGMFSSEKLKDVGAPVDGKRAVQAVEKSPAKHWSYKPGEGDGSTQPRMGPMAESLASAAPEVSDGTMVDPISMLGLHHAAIGKLSKDMRALKARRGD